MIELIIWFWALICPNHNHTIQHHGDCQLLHVSTEQTSTDDGEDGTIGETGNFPPKPPVPPPPPPR